MKKFNKRPSKAAVNKAIEFYRTEAKNTDEQLTVPCSDMCIHSIRDYAVAHGIINIGTKQLTSGYGYVIIGK